MDQPDFTVLAENFNIFRLLNYGSSPFDRKPLTPEQKARQEARQKEIKELEKTALQEWTEEADYPALLEPNDDLDFCFGFGPTSREWYNYYENIKDFAFPEKDGTYGCPNCFTPFYKRENDKLFWNSKAEPFRHGLYMDHGKRKFMIYCQSCNDLFNLKK